MKTGIFFTGTGPILLMTSYESFKDKNFITKLSSKGIKKFVAYEIAENKVKEKYGQRYKSVLGDLKQTDDLRVLDYDGHHVFYNFPINDFGEAITHEE